MLSIVVLGAAAGGGVPQWNCGCANCNSARSHHPELRATQASIAISADGAHWFLVNASPDLRQQITATPQLHPKAGELRHSPIAGVILTNGEVDAVAGLLSLREGWPFKLYAHERVLSILADNPIFNVLNPALVERLPIALDQPLEPSLPDGAPSGLAVTAFAAPGKTALFLEGRSADAEGDTVGLVITDKATGQRLVFLAACAAVTPSVAAHLAGAALVFFDGTLWRDDEMIAMGLSKKTGQRMGHIAMQEAIPALAALAIDRRVFLHINNSNPALRPGSPERRAAEAAGWRIPADGMEILL
ncbi:MAG TPA: pyrroloquinoline quinone biosynthesis protein PqqB [Devosiaceae bacterium]|jgi:pyrroloquinoline quinone biosynthesis protein B